MIHAFRHLTARSVNLAAIGLLLSAAAFAQEEDPRGMKVRGSALVEVYSESRTALVIGNGAYAVSPLTNPSNDAADVATLLEKRKFTVVRLLDADQPKMEAAIRDFGKRLSAGGVGVFYYSGHAVQVGGRNFLLPVGAEIRSETDVRNRAVDAGLVLEQMENSRNRLNVVILDACRDNPLPAPSARPRAGWVGWMPLPGR